MFSYKVDLPDLEKVAAGLGKGTELRREFGKEMRKIAKTAVDAERDAVMGLSSNARRTQTSRAFLAANELRGRKSVSVDRFFQAVEGAGLRRSIANSINAIIRYQGKDVGVRVRAQSSKMPKGMERLAKLTNRGEWSHPIFGKGGPQAVKQTTSPKQWWSKTREQIFKQARGDFEALLREYAKKVANNVGG